MTTLTRLAALAALLALLVACGPPQDPSWPLRMETDSIGFQYAIAGGQAQWPSVRWNSTMGATMATCPIDTCRAPATDMDGAVRAGHLPRVVIELGVNDAYDGWTSSDVLVWTRALDGLPQDTCAVVVLPWSTGADAPRIAPVRSWLSGQATKRANVKALDWKPYASRPGVLGPDGTHLAPGAAGNGDYPISAEAFDAWHDLVAAAARLCPAT